MSGNVQLHQANGAGEDGGSHAFRDATVAFAVDISGSTYGMTLAAEKEFIRSVAGQLTPRSKFSAKILPWDDRAHPSRSLANVNSLEDKGGTDPRAILRDHAHKSALLGSSLWFLMTDGLIPKENRAVFAQDISRHGVHGISCVIVIFGNPSTGPSSCDISVGISVFAVSPNSAFLFCNETNGDLRILQTKGTFNVLLKGRPHPTFDEPSQWNSLPQVSISDFASVVIPTPKHLQANQVELQGSLVINMDDLFANRLSGDEITRILANQENLASVMWTSQSRNQQDRFQSWIREQTIRPDDPLFKPRVDYSHAESIFTELVGIVSRGRRPPDSLRRRLRAAYKSNMRQLVGNVHKQHVVSQARQQVINDASERSTSNVDRGYSLNALDSKQLNYESDDELKHTTWKIPSACMDRREPKSEQARYKPDEDEAWGAWEASITDESMRGLLYTTGLRSTSGSFRGTCPLCGATDITLAWLFRAPVLPSTHGTPNFPPPESRTPLAFPLAMGHFIETTGILVSPQSPFSGFNATFSNASLNTMSGTATPSLVCDPCSTFYTQHGASSFGITMTLPLVRYRGNEQAIHHALSVAFEGRFADAHLAQIFLSVLVLAAGDRPPRAPSTVNSLHDIDTAAAAAAAANTFYKAIDWTISDLLHSIPAIRELSQYFSQLSAPRNAPQPLGAVLADWFEVVYDEGPLARVPASHGAEADLRGVPLLQYPLWGFIVMLRAGAVVGVTEEARRRVAFWRLLYLFCEQLEQAVRNAEGTGPPLSPSAEQLLKSIHLSAALGGGGTESPPDVPTLAVDVSLSSMRSVELLGQHSYEIMSHAEEFRQLEDPLITWVRPALTIFLHGLSWAVKNRPRKPTTSRPGAAAWQTFEAVVSLEAIRKAFMRPQNIDTGDVVGIWEQIQAEA